MKIGLVLPSVPNYSETFFNSKILGLQESGLEVILFINNPKPIPVPNKILNCKVYHAKKIPKNLGFRSIQSLLSIFEVLIKAPKTTLTLWQLHRRHGDSISLSLRSLVVNAHILTHQVDWLHFAFATMGLGRELVGKAMNAKPATSFRGYDISIYPLKHPNCYLRLWENIEKVHTISNDLLSRAYELKLPRSLPVHKITPAIKAERFVRNEISQQTNSPLRILTVGRLHWKKGGELTLEALKILQQNGLAFKYTWAGEGREIERLKFAAHQMELKDEVSFIGKIKHSEVPQLMHDNDMYIQYSLQEGFCNAVLEAQAAGMLVIVSDAEGLSENVVHQETGWVVPKMNPDALAEGIMTVLALPEAEKIKMRERARKRVLEHFTLEQQQAAFAKFYNS